MGQKKLRRKPYRRRRWRSYLGFSGKTFWDWLPIVGALLIPVVIALGTWRITTQQGKLEDQRAQAEQELAEQRAQDEALQAYLDQIGSLMLERNLISSAKDSPVRELARAGTLTILERLDKGRKSSVMAFLIEASLIQKVDTRPPVISLEEANLKGAAFGVENGSSLSSQNALSEAFIVQETLPRDPESADANLHGANLSFANMHHADLFIEDLGSTNLFHADLSGADLRGANLSGANLQIANLHGAKLQGATVTSDADLSGANLSGANLSGANLSGANLSGAYKVNNEGAKQLITNEELEQQAHCLKGAIMPDGHKYEESRKSCGEER